MYSPGRGQSLLSFLIFNDVMTSYLFSITSDPAIKYSTESHHNSRLHKRKCNKMPQLFFVSVYFVKAY